VVSWGATKKRGTPTVFAAHPGSELLTWSDPNIENLERLTYALIYDRSTDTMIGALDGTHPITLAVDKSYDTRDFVAEMRRLGVTSHGAQTPRAGIPRLTAAPRRMVAT
jgi:hypothetical protein